jgi:hypothetical protein
LHLGVEKIGVHCLLNDPNTQAAYTAGKSGAVIRHGLIGGIRILRVNACNGLQRDGAVFDGARQRTADIH